jgi:DNA-binding FadR family transcriptional regulator
MLATAADTSAAQLRARVLSGEWAPGDRLPPERTLADEAGLNRVTVRAALKKLEAEGLVEVRQGRGYTVLDFRQTAGPMLLAPLAALDEAASGVPADRLFADLLLLRRHLARALFEVLLKKDDLDLAPTRAAIDRFEGALDDESLEESPEGLRRIVELDLGVVSALVASSGSVVLQLCFNPVAAVLRSQPRLAASMFRTPRDNVMRWRAVVEIIALQPPGLLELVSETLEAFDQTTLTSLDADELVDA